MEIPVQDIQILRDLAKQYEEIGQAPSQAAIIQGWKDLNALKGERPMLWITELPWQEMNVDDELTLRCSHPFAREQEMNLRRQLYQHRHFPVDTVFEPAVYAPMAVSDTGFGLDEKTDERHTDAESEVYSRHFHPQLTCIDDVEKIRKTTVSHDGKKTKENVELLENIYDNILRVKKRGAIGFFFKFSPWDELITLFGVQEGLTLLYDDPDFVHAAVAKMMEVHLDRLDQYERMNLLTPNTGYSQIGSGGYGYTDEFGSNQEFARAKDMWGSSTAQIFTSVSPEMHDEFSIQYEKKWLERFAMTYYGCCEPLHRKVKILEQIPNLRKISMSRWINLEEGTANVGDRYVFSYKPNSAIFAATNWSLDSARNELKTLLENGRKHNCQIEIIMKNVSTTLHQPQRVWEWAAMAQEMIQKYYGS